MTTTWDEFAAIAAEFSSKTKRKGMYGSTDESGIEPTLETWLRQRGKAIYDTKGALGYDEGDVTDWFQMWADMRAAGAVPPADVEAMDQGNIDTSLFTQGRSALAFSNSNEFIAYKSMTPDAMGLAPYPKVGPDGKGGMYIKPSQFFSISARTSLPDDSADFINFLLTDAGSNEVLGGERGLPSSAAARAELRNNSDDVGKLMIDYISNLGDLAGPLPPPNPPGGGEVNEALLKASQEVSFGAKSPAEGAKSFIESAKEILSRAG